MAKLYFKFGQMNAQKSMQLLATAYNYEESGKTVEVFTPAVDDRYGVGKVTSRVGLEREALAIDKDFKLIDYVSEKNPNVILVDEAQFLPYSVIYALADVVTYLKIPVICYGLLKDFQGQLFEGSRALIENGAEMQEIKTMCAVSGCEKKATYVLRLKDGVPIYNGPKIVIGGNNTYRSVCREHFFKPNL